MHWSIYVNGSTEMDFPEPILLLLNHMYDIHLIADLIQHHALGCCNAQNDAIQRCNFDFISQNCP